MKKLNTLCKSTTTLDFQTPNLVFSFLLLSNICIEAVTLQFLYWSPRDNGLNNKEEPIEQDYIICLLRNQLVPPQKVLQQRLIKCQCLVWLYNPNTV